MGLAGLARLIFLAPVLAVVLAAGLAACGREPAPSPTPDLSADLREAVGVVGVLEHARRFQAIAGENGGNRAAGTPGYDASAEYVAGELREAGYEVTVQRFEFPASAASRDAGLELLGPDASGDRGYARGEDFAPMEQTESGAVEARLQPVDAESPTSGCEDEDFDGFREGRVALLRRGTCTFETKAENAEKAGATAALVFNAGEPEDEVLLGALGGTGVGIPVVGTSAEVGEDLLEGGAAEVRVSVDEGPANRTTNVIAQTPGGDAANTVMVGAHLDSVAQGPGINDNGSGSATVLEVAQEMSRLDAEPRNRVRFAFWGAEELGLVGSRHYVKGLNEDQLEDISAYLNFDMVASPNFIRMVYEGPDEVEDVFGNYFDKRDIEVETNSALDGRSDHGPFQAEGIPTGGLFSGAGGTKTREQADAFGGEAGAPFDACYHEACDTVENLNEKALGQLSDGAAHATAVLAERRGG